MIFDLDGTLVDSLPDLAAAMNATLDELGYPSHPFEFYPPLIGSGIEVMIAGALPAARRSPPQVAAARTLMRAHYRRHALRTTRPYPGVRWLLAELVRRRVPLAVLSNKLHPETVQVVRGAFPGGAVPGMVLGLQQPRAARQAASGRHRGRWRTRWALANRGNCVLVVGDGDTDMLAARRCRRPGHWGRPGAIAVPRALLAAGAARLAARIRAP